MIAAEHMGISSNKSFLVALVLTGKLFPPVCSDAGEQHREHRMHGHQGTQAAAAGSEAGCPDAWHLPQCSQSQTHEAWGGCGCKEQNEPHVIHHHSPHIYKHTSNFSSLLAVFLPFLL